MSSFRNLRNIMKAGMLVGLSLMSSPAIALNIVVTNDDGLTSNVKALYEALKAEGHDVIVSVPCSGQSGMGGAILFLKPLSPLASDCLSEAAKVGDPGVGPMTKPGLSGDYYYVNGTPVMALLYALDVQAIARWGKAPDLVLSGPNEGQNVGYIVISSGTVSNAQYAAIRGIPAIALSADQDTADYVSLANPRSPRIAQLSVQLIRRLQKSRSDINLLPPGVTLNINFPRELKSPEWKLTRIGKYNAYKVKFVEDLGRADLTSLNQTKNIERSRLPGIAIEVNQAEPDPGEEDDEAVVYKKAIAVTPMQIAYDHPGETQHGMKLNIQEILGDLNDK